MSTPSTIDTTDTPSTGRRHRARLELLGYGLGDFGSNLVFQAVSVFLLVYYTDSVGLAAAVTATVFLINRIWDAVSGLVVAFLADRTRSRWGSYRPYLLFGSLPFGASLVLVFLGPPLDGRAEKIAYAVVTLFALETFYNIVNVPYAGMLAVVSPDRARRASLSSARFVGTMAAILVVAGAGPGVISSFDDQAEGYRTVSIVLAGLGVLAIVLCFAFTRERVVVAPEERLDIRRAWPVLAGNGPLWIIVGAVTLLFVGFTARNGTALYYFTYYLDAEALAGAFLGLQGAVGIVGALLTPWLVRRFDKHRTLALGMVVLAGSSLMNLALPATLPSLVNGALGGLGIVISSSVTFAMVADTVDVTRRRTGILAAALPAALVTAGTKLGTALGGALVGFGLAAGGYVANTAQEPRALTAIHLLLTLVPAVAALAVAAVVLRYPLTAARLQQLDSEIPT